MERASRHDVLQALSIGNPDTKFRRQYEQFKTAKVLLFDPWLVPVPWFMARHYWPNDVPAFSVNEYLDATCRELAIVMTYGA